MPDRVPDAGRPGSGNRDTDPASPGDRRRTAAGPYRLLLRAYPPSLRRRYGDEMLRVFRERRTAARRDGVVSVALLWLAELIGALGAVGRRLRAPGDSEPGPTPSRFIPPRPRANAMDDLRQDLVYAVRSLRRSPVLTAAVVVALALGIGASASIFSVVDAVLLDPLPFAEPHRLVALYETNPERGWVRAQVAAANFLDWRERSERLEAIGAWFDWTDGMALTGSGDPEMLVGNRITGNLFDVLGVEPALGRGFLEEETWSGSDPVAILSHGLWRRRFGGDRATLGETITLDGVERTVVGVMPREFRFPFEETEIWLPTEWDPAFREQIWFRRAHGLRAVGRLAPGRSVREARAELDAIAAALEGEHPETNEQMGVGMTPLHEWVVGDVRGRILILFAAVVIVLLVACADVAHLMLTRASDRRREMAVRSALGAGRARLVRQVLTESLLLATAGGALGLLLSVWSTRALVAVAPEEIPRLDEVSVDPALVLFGAVAVTLTTLLFGLVPAIRASRTDPDSMLRVGGRGTSGVARTSHAGRGLVAVEVALAVVLAVGGGLLARSFWHLRSVDPGFDADGVLTAKLRLPASRYGDLEEVSAFIDELLPAVRSLPGVETAAVTRQPPMGQGGWTSDFTARDWPEGRYGVGVAHREVTPGYFEAVDVPLIRGRPFDEGDRADAPGVVVINETLARTWFPDRDPVGVEIAFDRVADEGSIWRTIVGVVGDEKNDGLASPSRPEIFAPLHQDATRGFTLVVESTVPPLSLVAAIRRETLRVDPDLPIHDVRLLGEIVASSLARERFLLRLMAAFALSALILACIGVYGVVAHATRKRFPEIGLRLALGAVPADVVRLVLRQGLLPVVLGIGVGIPGAAAAARLLRGTLHGIAPLDPLTYLGVAVAILAAGGFACWLPARRATRVDPAIALREG